MMASVYLTISLTVERYFSVVKPFLHLGNRWAAENFLWWSHCFISGIGGHHKLFCGELHLVNRWAPETFLWWTSSREQVGTGNFSAMNFISWTGGHQKIFRGEAIASSREQVGTRNFYVVNFISWTGGHQKLFCDELHLGNRWAPEIIVAVPT